MGETSRSCATRRALAAAILVGVVLAPTALGRPGVPATGTYLYDVAGESTSARYTVTPLPRGYAATLRLGSRYRDSSAFRVDLDGAWRERHRIDAERPPARDRPDVLRPPALYMPQVLTVGASWPFDSRIGGERERGSGRVLRTERLLVAGEPIDVAVVIVRTTTTGSVRGSRREVIWWDAARSLPVRLLVTAVRRGRDGYRTRIRMDLRAVAPR